MTTTDDRPCFPAVTWEPGAIRRRHRATSWLTVLLIAVFTIGYTCGWMVERWLWERNASHMIEEIETR